MKVTVDTNILARAVLQDEPKQAKAAAKLLSSATLIAVPTPCLCELVWVLMRGAGHDKDSVCNAIQALLDTENVVMNRPAVEAGLSVLASGGDFADGVIAYEGGLLGGEIFASFDKRAVALVKRQGQETLQL